MLLPIVRAYEGAGGARQDAQKVRTTGALAPLSRRFPQAVKAVHPRIPADVVIGMHEPRA
jgi:hypothetical protein